MFTEVSKQRHFHLKFGKETGEGAVQRSRSLNFQESVLNSVLVHVHDRLDMSTRVLGTMYGSFRVSLLFISVSQHLAQSDRNTVVLKN